MSITESLHRAHKARLARIASRAVPQAEPEKGAPRAAPVWPRPIIDRNYERAWAAAILGWVPQDGRLRARPRIEEIQRATAQHFGLTCDELLADGRARAVARPRQVAMYLAKELTTTSCAEIGNCFGGRDHTSVVHALKRIRQLLARDDQLRASVECIRRTLDVL